MCCCCYCSTVIYICFSYLIVFIEHAFATSTSTSIASYTIWPISEWHSNEAMDLCTQGCCHKWHTYTSGCWHVHQIATHLIPSTARIQINKIMMTMIHGDPLAFMCDRMTQHIIYNNYISIANDINSFTHKHIHPHSTSALALARNVCEEEDEQEKMWTLLSVLLKCVRHRWTLFSSSLLIWFLFCCSIYLAICSDIVIVIIIDAVIAAAAVCIIHNVFIRPSTQKRPVHTYDYENRSQMMWDICECGEMSSAIVKHRWRGWRVKRKWWLEAQQGCCLLCVCAAAAATATMVASIGK